MIATVRGFHSPDVDLATYAPEEPGNVGVLVEVSVGTQGSPGEDLFQVMVCTPRWIDQFALGSGPLIGRHFLFVKRWDWTAVREYLTHAFEQEQGDSWADLAARLGRIGKWEFEDYKP